MIPSNLQTLFWDTNLATFDPTAYPDYTIFRVLEYGDEPAVEWLRQTFSEAEIRRVLRTERRLSRKSANFWALVYGIPPGEVAALDKAG
ncbi:MAG: hypothetical protein WA188_06820 [Terriglobales bacterium]